MYHPTALEEAYGMYLLETIFQVNTAVPTIVMRISGRNAVPFLSQSQVHRDVLRNIWSTVDPEAIGSLTNAYQFYAILRMVALAQNGLVADLATLNMNHTGMPLAVFQGYSVPDELTLQKFYYQRKQGVVLTTSDPYQQQQQLTPVVPGELGLTSSFDQPTTAEVAPEELAPSPSAEPSLISIEDAFGGLIEVEDAPIPALESFAPPIEPQTVDAGNNDVLLDAELITVEPPHLGEDILSSTMGDSGAPQIDPIQSNMANDVAPVMEAAVGVGPEIAPEQQGDDDDDFGDFGNFSSAPPSAPSSGNWGALDSLVDIMDAPLPTLPGIPPTTMTETVSDVVEDAVSPLDVVQPDATDSSFGDFNGPVVLPAEEVTMPTIGINGSEEGKEIEDESFGEFDTAAVVAQEQLEGDEAVTTISRDQGNNQDEKQETTDTQVIEGSNVLIEVAAVPLGSINSSETAPVPYKQDDGVVGYEYFSSALPSAPSSGNWGALDSLVGVVDAPLPSLPSVPPNMTEKVSDLLGEAVPPFGALPQDTTDSSFGDFNGPIVVPDEQATIPTDGTSGGDEVTKEVKPKEPFVMGSFESGNGDILAGPNLVTVEAPQAGDAFVSTAIENYDSPQVDPILVQGNASSGDVAPAIGDREYQDEEDDDDFGNFSSAPPSAPSSGNWGALDSLVDLMDAPLPSLPSMPSHVAETGSGLLGEAASPFGEFPQDPTDSSFGDFNGPIVVPDGQTIVPTDSASGGDTTKEANSLGGAVDEEDFGGFQDPSTVVTEPVNVGGVEELSAGEVKNDKVASTTAATGFDVPDATDDADFGDFRQDPGSDTTIATEMRSNVPEIPGSSWDAFTSSSEHKNRQLPSFDAFENAEAEPAADESMRNQQAVTLEPILKTDHDDTISRHVNGSLFDGGFDSGGFQSTPFGAGASSTSCLDSENIESSGFDDFSFPIVSGAQLGAASPMDRVDSSYYSAQQQVQGTSSTEGSEDFGAFEDAMDSAEQLTQSGQEEDFEGFAAFSAEPLPLPTSADKVEERIAANPNGIAHDSGSFDTFNEAPTRSVSSENPTDLSVSRDKVVSLSHSLPRCLRITVQGHNNGPLVDFGSVFDRNVGIEPLNEAQLKRVNCCLHLIEMLSSSASNVVTSAWAETFSIVSEEAKRALDIFEDASQFSPVELSLVKDRLCVYFLEIAEMVRVTRNVTATIGDILLLEPYCLLTVDTLESSWASLQLARDSITIEATWKEVEDLVLKLSISTEEKLLSYPSLVSIRSCRSEPKESSTSTTLCHGTLQPLPPVDAASTTTSAVHWKGRPFMACAANFLAHRINVSNTS